MTGSSLILSLAFLAATLAQSRAIAADATKPAATQRSAPAVIESHEQHVRFQYPADWTLVRKVSDARVPLGVSLRIGTAAKPSGQVVVTVAKAVEDTPAQLVIFSAMYLTRMGQAYKDFKVVEQGRGKVAERPAARDIVTYGGADNPLRQLLYFAIRGDKAYMFTYWAPTKEFDAGLPAFEKLVGSVEWIN